MEVANEEKTLLFNRVLGGQTIVERGKKESDRSCSHSILKPLALSGYGVFQIPGGVDVYELRNHALVDGMVDVLRLNTYLSRDGSFITIWNGLIEPMLAEGQFDIPDLPSFQDMYRETLFRGHIEWNEEALVILKALRIDSGRQSVPQQLAGAPNDLRCEMLPPG